MENASKVTSFRFDPVAERLYVALDSGRRFVYLDVPAWLAKELVDATSLDEAFDFYIRDSFAGFDLDEYSDPVDTMDGTLATA
jgi:KTSC domain